MVLLTAERSVGEAVAGQLTRTGDSQSAKPWRSRMSKADRRRAVSPPLTVRAGLGTGRKTSVESVTLAPARKSGGAVELAASASTVARPSAAEAVRTPRSIHDISNGNHIMGYGANLSEDHPGYHDEDYKARRSQIADLAKQHQMGQPIPDVDYTPSEVATWRAVFTKLQQLYPTHACQEFLDALPLFHFTPTRIPQLQELSDTLGQRTGFQLRPVAGLLHPRDFLNGLAFKYFHSTQYIRYGGNPMYTPEPDICHELLGHVPLLANPDYAELAQAIGMASLGASEKDIWHLTKLYWYTIEFGVIWEEGEIKAFGAGLLSSFGELAWMKSGDEQGRQPQYVELNPFAKLPKMSYKDGFQQTYFVCESFSDVARKVRSYANHLRESRPRVLEGMNEV